MPYWVIPDTKGALKGLLHTCRRFELCRDVIVLISEETPKEYIEHLKERKYSYHVVGKKHVNIERALEILASEHGVKLVLADTGMILGNLLLNQGLVSEISLLIHPIIVGDKLYNIFSNVRVPIALKLDKAEILSKGYLWMVYTVHNDVFSKK